jgi:cation diffusion facilitator family transporter
MAEALHGALPQDRSRAQRVALTSLVAAIGLVAAKLAAGAATGSLAILSEAAHSGLDAGATGLTYFAVRIASRPPDEEHPYGHGKAENISALIETVALFVLSVLIAKEAIARLQSGAGARAPWYGFAVIAVSIVVDGSRAIVLRRAGRRYASPALEADALHFTADMFTSIAVLIGLGLVRMGVHSADALGGLAIAAFVAYSSIRLGRRSIDVLMDRAPAGAMQQMRSLTSNVPGVDEVRRVRVRRVGGRTEADVVIAVSRTIPLEIAHHLTEEVEGVIRENEPGAEVVVHVEPVADEQAVAEQVASIAARHRNVRQVHNIFAASQDDGLHISLHAKFPGDMPLRQAHDIAEDLEESIKEEIPGVARVDTHLEPLEAEPIAADATQRQTTLAAWARALAEQQPEVQNCHEIAITDAAGALSMVMHCEAPPGLSVTAVHNAATRIEDEVHRHWPQVERVTVHFEPQSKD